MHEVVTLVPTMPLFSTPSTSLKNHGCISNHPLRVKIPHVRTPPPDLWQISPPPGSSSKSPPTSFSVSTHIADPPGLAKHSSRRPRPTFASPSTSSTHPPQERAERRKRVQPSSAADPPDPPRKDLAKGQFLTSVEEWQNGKAILGALNGNKSRNPRSPCLISMLNPLREQLPPQVWTIREIRLPSSRYRNPLCVMPLRKRRDCELAVRDLMQSQTSTEAYLSKTIRHCTQCRRDSLLKKLLVLRNYILASPPIVGLNETAAVKENRDPDANLLDTPTLRDLDDFDEVDDSGDREGDILILDMSELSEMTGSSLF